MGLPQIMAPTFELVVPSTGETIEYRPYLVKEEKILLVAREGGERHEIMKAIAKIINACVETEGFDIKKLTIFDLEYIFIKIRSKSVNNIVKFQVTDKDDGKAYELEVDLEEVQVDMTNLPDKKIMIEKDIGVMMKYPSITMTDNIEKNKTLTDLTFFIVDNCIDYVFDAENVYPWSENSKKEREAWLNNISVEAYEKITEFFEKVPNMNHVVKYKNSEEKEKEVVFRTLEDFFALD